MKPQLFLALVFLALEAIMIYGQPRYSLRDVDLYNITASRGDVEEVKRSINMVKTNLERLIRDTLGAIAKKGEDQQVSIQAIMVALLELKKQVANHTTILSSNNSGSCSPLNDTLKLVENKTADMISLLNNQLEDTKEEFVKLINEKTFECQYVMTEPVYAEIRSRVASEIEKPVNTSYETSLEVKKLIVGLERNVTKIERRLKVLTRGPQPCFDNIDMPKSCEDLWCLGNKKNGFYSVTGKDSNNKRIEMIYCNFNAALLQDEQSIPKPRTEKRIGFVDVKSSPVHFYVQRKTPYISSNTVIPYEIERLNVGGAMDLKTGTFTAPTNGTYQFGFSSLRLVEGFKKEIQTDVRLRRNGVILAGSYGTQENWIGTIGFHSTLKLQAGDKIDVLLLLGGIYDIEPNQWTQFTGSLLEEDLKIY